MIPIAKHIYVVEDEPELASLMAQYLKQSGYEVSTFARGDVAVDAFRRHQADMIILDLMLPGKDGLSVCRELRAFSNVPIIMVTARVDEVDRLLGLELGADDYLCKPFSPRELVARAKVIFRRLEPGFGGVINNKRLMIDIDTMSASLDGAPLHLTPLELKLLHHVSINAGRVYSRNQLLDTLYDDQRVVTDRTIDSHVKNIRKKMKEANGKEEEWIHSIYGMGYKFEWV